MVPVTQPKGFGGPTREIRNYPIAAGFVAALAALVAGTMEKAEVGGAPLRLLFSAHGLPLKIVASGDPYPREIESTARPLPRSRKAP